MGEIVRVGVVAVATKGFWGCKFARALPREEATALITEARELAGDDPAAQAALALADAGRALTDAISAAQGPDDNAVPETISRAEQALELAHRTGDPLAESAALDTLTSALSWVGDTFAAAEATRRRIALLSSAPDTPAGTYELIEALGEAAETSLGTGDLPGARRYARQLADHPFLAEVGHRATGWLLVADALAGNAGQVLTVSVRFLDAWRQAGSPATPVLGPPMAGVAMIHGLRDDHGARRDWSAVLNQVDPSPGKTCGYGAVFEAILMLHRGQAQAALKRMAPEPDEVWQWVTCIWHHWYVAPRAEAATLARTPDARGLLADARTRTAGNPVAGAIVARAEALLDNNQEQLLATADVFDATGCSYQATRTMVLASGEHAARGAATLTGLGLAPMILPRHASSPHA